MTSTVLRYRSTTPTTADAMARVHAAALAAPRKAAEADRALAIERRHIERAHRCAREVVAELGKAGAVRVGFKICHTDGHKIRDVLPIGEAYPLIFRTYADDDYSDAEVWGIRADGTYCEGVY
jgi:hypothetical protein